MPDKDYLCFTAEEAGSTVSMTAVGSAPSVSLEYSTDGTTWSDFIVGTTTVTLAAVGDKVYLRGDNTRFCAAVSGNANHNAFSLTGEIAASGNLMSVLDSSVQATSFSESYVLAFLFYGCTGLRNASALRLPAMSLAAACYYSLFEGCTNLISAPELPATTLVPFCYQQMFRETGLTTPVTLPATQLPVSCYLGMFQGCTGIKLSATQDSVYTTPYRLPPAGTGSAAFNWNTNMFINTGGTFTGNPALNTTYYGAWDPAPTKLQNLYFGADKIDTPYIGSTELKGVYVGSTAIYENQ